MRALQEYTRLKTRPAEPADLSWWLLLDSMIFQAEAEVRWLDHCEAALVRYRHRPSRPAAPPVRPGPPPPAPPPQLTRSSAAMPG
jgi:hypothetical protein